MNEVPAVVDGRDLAVSALLLSCVRDAAMDVCGNTDGCLRLGSQTLWIKLVEKRPSREVRDAILGRRPSDTMAAVPAQGSAVSALTTGCLIAAAVVFLGIVLWLVRFRAGLRPLMLTVIALTEDARGDR